MILILLKDMLNLYSDSSLTHFFTEIYNVIRNVSDKIDEVWCEISEIIFLKRFNKIELKNFLDNFEFISLEKGNYTYYLVINKILFILESIKFLKLDIKEISEILDYKGFETLIQAILSRNNYRTLKNFRFSDSSNFKDKTSQERYEIDVVGVYLKYILIIDAKQWRRKDSYFSLNKAANLQCRRAIALKENPDVFSGLIKNILGKRLNLKKDFPFVLIPIIVTLEDNSNKINDNQIPLVSIYKFNSFLQELPKNLKYFKTIKIEHVIIEKKLQDNK